MGADRQPTLTWRSDHRSCGAASHNAAPSRCRPVGPAGSRVERLRDVSLSTVRYSNSALGFAVDYPRDWQATGPTTQGVTKMARVGAFCNVLGTLSTPFLNVPDLYCSQCAIVRR